ncbi:hypothetical protein HC256_001285 [Beauveria bassiana]|nr:hypothetical protein HC256_001285 [Beauveria bassiana]
MHLSHHPRDKPLQPYQACKYFFLTPPPASDDFRFPSETSINLNPCSLGQRNARSESRSQISNIPYYQNRPSHKAENINPTVVELLSSGPSKLLHKTQDSMCFSGLRVLGMPRQISSVCAPEDQLMAAMLRE